MSEDLWRVINTLRQDVRELRGQLDSVMTRIRALEADTPQARQLQLEADLAAADLAESGYGRHGPGCQCPYCCDDPDDCDDYHPGPECDDQGGMSEYQHGLPDDGQVWQP
jgi:hypothetical protein